MPPQSPPFPAGSCAGSPECWPSDAAAPDCDLLVVGGGINGAGIARDAVGRGLRVALCEQHDLAAHTSSASTKLIHGGLRYLEHFEFGLVRKALAEREVLLRAAPHLIRPLRFVVPHDPAMRPAWMIRAGLFVYDHLAHRDLLPGARTLDLRAGPLGAPLKPGCARGFAYWDALADDARLVVLTARDAADRGAAILTRTALLEARRDAAGWTARLRGPGGAVFALRARALVNAAGPWADTLRTRLRARHAGAGLRLVRGSHIVVDRLFEHDSAYLFQSPDRRVVFAIPWESRFTLIGTTDVEHLGDPGEAHIDPQEAAYLCALANRHFRAQIAPADVVWSYSGVRALLDGETGDPAQLTRDYALALDLDGAPLLSVLGGKITTFRKLAEEAVDTLAPHLGARAGAWTRDVPLPGGDLDTAGSPPDFERFLSAKARELPWLPEAMLRHYARCYGTRLERVLAGARTLEALGEALAPGLHEAELDYLVMQEWAVDADDVLWRRTKLGLGLAPDARARVDRWMRARTRGVPQPPADTGVRQPA